MLIDSETLRAVILGVVQGIAEFLPISSSGHLVIADALIKEFTGSGLDESAMAMNVALHVGSLVSILIVFRNDITKLLRDPRLCMLILLASVPVGVTGIMLKDYLETAFTEPLLPAIALLVTAFMLVIGQRLESGVQKLDKLPWHRAAVIGLFQAIAIIPGISRSGSTIAGGMLLGLDRQTAARFSFLMAIVPIAGAGLLEVLGHDSASSASIAVMPLIIGAVTSCIVGYLALNWLLRIISERQLHRFAIYCVLVAIATATWRLPVLMSDDPAGSIATEQTETRTIMASKSEQQPQ